MADIDTTQITTVTEFTRLVRLSYLQTVAALDDSALVSRLAGESQGSSKNFTASDPGSPGFLGIGAEGPSTVSSTFSDSGWAISRTWLETWWDKIRWAIGVREIGIYSFEYEESSEIVSIPFRSPKPISKVSLRVDELVPSSYPTNIRWIQYFVSPDNGNTWHRINPLDTPSSFNESSGIPIPRIINFNPDFSTEDDDQNKYIKTNTPVIDIRFKAVLIRPSGEDFLNTSPILKGYRLLIYPKEGLQ
jgi:hypothetical protein